MLNVINSTLVNVNYVPPPLANPRNSDGEKVCLSESPLCHYLSLSDSRPKKSIFLPFVMSE